MSTNLLERYAKLTSQVEERNNGFVVEVLTNDNNGVMWLNAQLFKRPDDDIPVLSVSTVDFDSKIFFNLPQREQDTCALVLFKAFLKYYEANYGKDSGNWLPVQANFANYKLQEKFKKAVAKGIFPPESEEFSHFIDEDESNKSLHYNMDNRRLMYQTKNDPAGFLAKYNVDNLPTEGGAFVNVPISQVKPIYERALEDIDSISGNELLIVAFEANKILLTFDFLPLDLENASYALGDNCLYLEDLDRATFLDFVQTNLDLFQTVFDQLDKVYDNEHQRVSLFNLQIAGRQHSLITIGEKMKYASLLERYAKLYADVSGSEDEFTVDVYNSENELVMWLSAEINDITFIDVSEVNFMDNTFFNLPQREQDNCALILFKTFLKYYEANYGKDSPQWLPVSASFANYKLQEKFKSAVAKGIFPPESLGFSAFTSEEDWKDNITFNMDNRKLQYDINQDPIATLAKYNVDNLPTDGTAFINVPTSQITLVCDRFNEDYPSLANEYLIIEFDSETIKLKPGFLKQGIMGKTKYDLDTHVLFLSPKMTSDNLIDFVKSNTNLFWSVFDELSSVVNTATDSIIDMNELHVADRHTRLVRR